MKRTYPWLLLLSITLWSGCSGTTSGQKATNEERKVTEAASTTPTPAQSQRPYSKDLEELRAAFNRDKGKVRLVTLLSPT
jgi:ABC-type glycerol-3-phosphate transport system substrate-binding protein